MITVFGLTPRTFVATTLAIFGTALLLASALPTSSCSPQPGASDVTAQADKVRERLGTVLEFLDAAQQTANASNDVANGLAAASLAIDREHYREAVGHLRTALLAAQGAGVTVPEEVPRGLVEAELLLGIVGQ